MRIILLIMIGISMLHADFTRSGDIVTDSVSGLQWQDDEIGTNSNWQGAIDRCESLELSNHSDWRVPNINELKSIVDRSQKDPAIANLFEHTISSSYWSSTTHKHEYISDHAWGVNFYYGNVLNSDKNYDLYIRCVRGGQ